MRNLTVLSAACLLAGHANAKTFEVSIAKDTVLSSLPEYQEMRFTADNNQLKLIFEAPCTFTIDGKSLELPPRPFIDCSGIAEGAKIIAATGIVKLKNDNPSFKLDEVKIIPGDEDASAFYDSSFLTSRLIVETLLQFAVTSDNPQNPLKVHADLCVLKKANSLIVGEFCDVTFEKCQLDDGVTIENNGNLKITNCELYGSSIIKCDQSHLRPTLEIDTITTCSNGRLILSHFIHTKINQITVNDGNHFFFDGQIETPYFNITNAAILTSGPNSSIKITDTLDMFGKCGVDGNVTAANVRINDVNMSFEVDQFGSYNTMNLPTINSNGTITIKDSAVALGPLLGDPTSIIVDPQSKRAAILFALKNYGSTEPCVIPSIASGAKHLDLLVIDAYNKNVKLNTIFAKTVHFERGNFDNGAICNPLTLNVTQNAVLNNTNISVTDYNNSIANIESSNCKLKIFMYSSKQDSALTVKMPYETTIIDRLAIDSEGGRTSAITILTDAGNTITINTLYSGNGVIHLPFMSSLSIAKTTFDHGMLQINIANTTDTATYQLLKLGAGAQDPLRPENPVTVDSKLHDCTYNKDTGTVTIALKTQAAVAQSTNEWGQVGGWWPSAPAVAAQLHSTLDALVEDFSRSKAAMHVLDAILKSDPTKATGLVQQMLAPVLQGSIDQAAAQTSVQAASDGAMSDHTSQILSTLYEFTRDRQVASGDEKSRRFGTWVAPYKGNSNTKFEQSFIDVDTSGFVTGFDAALSEKTVLGIAYNYGSSKGTYGEQQSTNKLNAFAVYGLYNVKDNLFVDGLVNYSSTSIENTAYRQMFAQDRIIQSKHKVNTLMLQGECTYLRDFRGIELELSGGGRYRNVSTDKYKQSGAQPIDITYLENKRSIVDALGSVAVSYSFFRGEFEIAPHIGLYGVYKLSGDSMKVNYHLGDWGRELSVDVAGAGKFYSEIYGGVNFYLGSLEIGVDGAIGNVGDQSKAYFGSVIVRAEF